MYFAISEHCSGFSHSTARVYFASAATDTAPFFNGCSISLRAYKQGPCASPRILLVTFKLQSETKSNTMVKRRRFAEFAFTHKVRTMSLILVLEDAICSSTWLMSQVTHRTSYVLSECVLKLQGARVSIDNSRHLHLKRISPGARKRENLTCVLYSVRDRICIGIKQI